MTDKGLSDGELDGLMREHFADRVEREGRKTPPVPGRRRGPAAPALRAAGLAAVAALGLWTVGSGWGRSPLREAAARFAAVNEFPQRIGEGLLGFNRILSGHFKHGGEG